MAERPRHRLRVRFGQKWKTGTARQYFTDICLQPLWHNRPAKLSNLVKKTKIKAITPFKVIEVGTNQKPVCDFLLLINSDWHPISYRFVVIAAYCANFGHFAFTDNVRYSSWAHWITRNRLPISVNWTIFARCYSWVATSENRSKIGDFAPTRSLWPKISDGRGRPSNHFCTDSQANECLTTLLLTVFIQRNFVADFLQAKCDFTPKTAVLRFWAPLWGGGA